MTFKTLEILEKSAHVTLVRLNRPEAANAINTLLANELSEALTQIKDHCRIRAVVLTGAGERAFCAGADLKERKNMDKSAWDMQHHAFEAARDAILALPIPIIAAVNGAAYAGGLEFALACDFIYAAPHAKFALTEATLGIMPGLGGTQMLPRRIGSAKALEMLLTGKAITAAQALDWGLVNAVVDAPLDEALNTAHHMANNAPLSVRAIKKAVRGGETLPLEKAFALELELYNTLIPTQDRIEGIAAFNEKRKAVFRGG